MQACNVLVDKDGALWMGSMGDGLGRIAFPETVRGRQIAKSGPEVEQFTKKEGLSADWIASALEDREGNVWFGTDHGLDRFRDGAFTPVSIPEGERPRSIVAARDGGLWTSAINRHGVWRIDADGAGKLIGADKKGAASMFEDETGILWLSSGADSLMRREGNRLVKVPLPNGASPRYTWSITRDRAGALWLLDQQAGVLRFSGGMLTNFSSDVGFVSAGGLLYTDRLGRIWIGQPDRIALYQDGKFHIFGARDGVPPGIVLAFQEDRAGNLWIGGNAGLSMFKDGRFHTLARPDGFPARSAFGIAEDAGGDWWVATDSGVLRMNPNDLQKAAADPGYRVSARRFNVLDGLPGNPRQNFPLPVICRATGGRIWVVAINGIAFVDPRRIPKNTVPPPVHVEAVRVNGAPIAPTDGIALTHATNDIEIDYTALSLSVPERVQFRYKLEGAETEWHDAGARRQAFYNHLGPNRYRFRVIASNNDGVWNETGAAWSFRMTPAFYQTYWFYLMCACLSASLLWALYQLRVRQIAAGMNARFDERMAERNRLAGELHDTILQTVQVTKMVADNARFSHSTDPVHLREAVESISDWLTQASIEGRAALKALRTSTVQRNDLAEAFQRAAEAHKGASTMRFDLSVEGACRDLHPIVRDEIYCIGSEAIRNAYLHSGAAQLEVSISYARNLTVRVRDNGRGMDPDMAVSGKPGHFGLRGMQERALRIQGKLRVLSRAGAGTEMELTVSGKTVYQPPDRGRRTWSGKLRGLRGPGAAEVDKGETE